MWKGGGMMVTRLLVHTRVSLLDYTPPYRPFPCVPCTGCTLRVNNRMSRLVVIHQGTVLAQIDQRSACTEVCGTHSTGHEGRLGVSPSRYTGSSGGSQAPQGRYQREFTLLGFSRQRGSVGSAIGTTPWSSRDTVTSNSRQ